jgi:hypothetical protein
MGILSVCAPSHINIPNAKEIIKFARSPDFFSLSMGFLNKESTAEYKNNTCANHKCPEPAKTDMGYTRKLGIVLSPPPKYIFIYPVTQCTTKRPSTDGMISFCNRSLINCLPVLFSREHFAAMPAATNNNIIIHGYTMVEKSSKIPMLGDIGNPPSTPIPL